MAASESYQTFDVIDIQLSPGRKHDQDGLAFHLHLRNGQTMTFALTHDQADSLAKEILARLNPPSPPPTWSPKR